jgi:hypothetical protein
MKKTIAWLELLALVLGAPASETALAADRKASCIPDKEISQVVSEIPNHFKRVGNNSYLIENIPEAKNNRKYSGILTVELKQGGSIAIFDRTDMNPLNWYNVSSQTQYYRKTGKPLEGRGCADWGIYLTGPGPVKHLSDADAQTKFNLVVKKVEDIISYK